MKHPLPLAAAIALLGLVAAAPAAAGPSQASVVPPGGFATACGVGLASNNGFVPGVDIITGGSLIAGKFNCQSETFAGAGTSASAAGQWAAGTVSNSASAQAGLGWLQMQATNTAPPNVQSPAGVGTGGWTETMTISSPGLAGQAAIWTFRVEVQAQMDTQAANLDRLFASAFKNKGELSNRVAGYSRGGSDAQTTDVQRVRWDAGRGADRTIVDVVTFAVPVTLGQSFSWGVYATLSAGMAAYSPSIAIPGTASAQALLRYGGSAGLTVAGQAVADYTLAGASGVDWLSASPVPEPGTAAMALLGVLALRAAVRRRRA